MDRRTYLMIRMYDINLYKVDRGTYLMIRMHDIIIKGGKENIPYD